MSHLIIKIHAYRINVAVPEPAVTSPLLTSDYKCTLAVIM